LSKSAQAIENKRVKLLPSAKNCKKAQKSAQEIDSKGADKRDKLFAGTGGAQAGHGKRVKSKIQAQVSNQQGTHEWRRYI
jgi:hypothetical protein